MEGGLCDDTEGVGGVRADAVEGYIPHVVADMVYFEDDSGFLCEAGQACEFGALPDEYGEGVYARAGKTIAQVYEEGESATTGREPVALKRFYGYSVTITAPRAGTKQYRSHEDVLASIFSKD